MPYRTADDRIEGVVVTFADITERKRAEDALAAELQTMTRLHELSGLALRSTDPQTLLEGILDATIELHGADLGNIQLYDADTKTLRIAAQRGFQTVFLDHFREVGVNEGSACGLALARGERVVIEDVETEPAYAPNLRAAREAGYRAVQSTPLLTPSGEPLGMLSTHFRERHRFAERELRLTDLYAREAADALAAELLQQALRASEERFRQFAENSLEVLWIAKPHMAGLEYLSPAYERIWGEPREATMTDLGHWAELIHPDDRERVSQAMPRVLAGEPSAIEYRIRRPSDGEIRWIRDTGFPIQDARGQVHRAAGIARDVTDEKHAAEELRAAHERISDILESIADGFYAVDDDWRLTFVNRRAEELWGRSREDILGMRLWNLFPNVDIEATEGYRLHMKAARERRPVREEYESVVFGFWVSVSIYPQRDGGLSVTFRDISDRRRAEEERELLARELSHRVKNVLAVVQSLAMQTDGRIQSVGAFRNSFVGRLQALARAHSVLLEANWRSADLGTLVEQAVAAYRVDHPEVVELEGEPVTITPRQGLGLSLVLHEAGTNASKYGALSRPEGRLRISWQVGGDDRSRRVRLQWQERNGPRAEPPGETGFGTKLIERACSYELDGEVELDYAPEGLTCEVVFPLE